MGINQHTGWKRNVQWVRVVLMLFSSIYGFSAWGRLFLTWIPDSPDWASRVYLISLPVIILLWFVLGMGQEKELQIEDHLID